jgi:hypothetical protein
MCAKDDDKMMCARGDEKDVMCAKDDEKDVMRKM